MRFTNVPAGTYYVRVRGITAGRIGAPSNVVTVVVSGTGCGTVPTAPTGLTASVVGRSVTLSWAAESGLNGPTTFVIEAGNAPGMANLAVQAIDGTLRGLTVDAPPGRYFVRIRGQNQCGISDASTEIIVEVS